MFCFDLICIAHMYVLRKSNTLFLKGSWCTIGRKSWWNCNVFFVMKFLLLYDLFIDLHVYAFILTQISWSHNWYTCITFLVTEMCFTSFFKCNYLILQMLFSLFRMFNSWLTVLLERTQWWKFFLTRWAWVSDFRCRDGYRNQQWLNNQLKTHYEFYMVMYR